MPVTLADRILAHLAAFPIESDAHDVPREVTQDGIADALAARVAHVSRALKSHITNGLVTAHLAHPAGGNRRARAHGLTPKGRDAAAHVPAEARLAAAQERVVARGPERPARALGAVPAGRALEFARLMSALDDARVHGPRFVLVEGDAGAGKSRLLDAFAAHAAGAGARVLRGASAPTGAQQVIGPLGPALEPLGFERRFRARVAGSPRERALVAAGESLGSAAREAPVALLLDDVHFAGATVAEFLHGLLRSLGGGDARVVVVAAVRREEGWQLPNGPLYTALMPLRDFPGTVHVDLAPLDRDGVAALLEDEGVHVLGDAKLSEAIVDRVWRESGGNASFALAMGKELADGVHEDDFFPRSVHTATQERFATLPENQLRVLQLAAVAGPEVDLETLLRAREAETTEDALTLALDGLIDRLFLEEVPQEAASGLRIRFGHPKVREALLTDLTATRRRHLEARIAAAVQHQD